MRLRPCAHVLVESVGAEELAVAGERDENERDFVAVEVGLAEVSGHGRGIKAGRGTQPQIRQTEPRTALHEMRLLREGRSHTCDHHSSPTSGAGGGARHSAPRSSGIVGNYEKMEKKKTSLSVQLLVTDAEGFIEALLVPVGSAAARRRTPRTHWRPQTRPSMAAGSTRGSSR